MRSAARTWELSCEADSGCFEGISVPFASLYSSCAASLSSAEYLKPLSQIARDCWEKLVIRWNQNLLLYRFSQIVYIYIYIHKRNYAYIYIGNITSKPILRWIKVKREKWLNHQIYSQSYWKLDDFIKIWEIIYK